MQQQYSIHSHTAKTSMHVNSFTHFEIELVISSFSRFSYSCSYR